MDMSGCRQETVHIALNESLLVLVPQTVSVMLHFFSALHSKQLVVVVEEGVNATNESLFLFFVFGVCPLAGQHQVNKGTRKWQVQHILGERFCWDETGFRCFYHTCTNGYLHVALQQSPLAVAHNFESLQGSIHG